MKATGILLPSFATAALLCLPAVSAFGSQPPPPNQTPNYQHRQDQNRQQANRGNRDEHSTRGHERLPAYSFGSKGQQRLRDRYNHTNYRREVNTRYRAHLSRGGYLPNGWRGRIHRLPPRNMSASFRRRLRAISSAILTGMGSSTTRTPA